MGLTLRQMRERLYRVPGKAGVIIFLRILGGLTLNESARVLGMSKQLAQHYYKSGIQQLLTTYDPHPWKPRKIPKTKPSPVRIENPVSAPVGRPPRRSKPVTKREKRRAQLGQWYQQRRLKLQSLGR